MRGLRIGVQGYAGRLGRDLDHNDKATAFSEPRRYGAMDQMFGCTGVAASAGPAGLAVLLSRPAAGQAGTEA